MLAVFMPLADCEKIHARKNRQFVARDSGKTRCR